MRAHVLTVNSRRGEGEETVEERGWELPSDNELITAEVNDSYMNLRFS